MNGNLENLGPLRLNIFGQGDATLIAERDTMNVARIHLTDYRRKERNPDRLHLARAIGEVPAMLAALRAMQADFEKYGSCATLPHAGTVRDILAKIDLGEITQ